MGELNGVVQQAMHNDTELTPVHLHVAGARIRVDSQLDLDILGMH